MNEQQDNTKVKRLVFTGVNQMLQLVKNNPAVINAIPKLAKIANLPENAPPQKTCACKKNITIVDNSKKQVVEHVLNSLNKDDFLIIKNILQLDQLCYYKRSGESNSLELICI
jgi:hypothetical protein